jgi:hypothetical protein
VNSSHRRRDQGKKKQGLLAIAVVKEQAFWLVPLADPFTFGRIEFVSFAKSRKSSNLFCKGE